MMRIITGSARGVRLEAPEGEMTRPTSERAKEALFSMLGTDLEGRRVLDLFAGSGQLGLEALSRGAEWAVFLESAKLPLAVLKRNAERTKLSARAEINQGEALSFLRTYRGAPFHLVFLDPPYASRLVPACLALLCERGLLTPGATVVCETGATQDVFGGDTLLQGRFSVLKQNRYGAAYLTLLTPTEEDFV